MFVGIVGPEHFPVETAKSLSFRCFADLFQKLPGREDQDSHAALQFQKVRVSVEWVVF